MDVQSIAVMRVPFVFTQDDLLRTDEFVDEAKSRGFEVALDDLRQLHELGLLCPLFRVDDDPDPRLVIDVPPPMGNDPGYSALLAASQGRLHDPAAEGYSEAFPFEIPEGLSPREWWNGYLYSSWQLLNLFDALRDREWIEQGIDLADRMDGVRRARAVTLALAALAPRFMPGVIGQLSLPPFADQEAYFAFRHEAGAAKLLEAVGYDPARLRPEAERLLGWAHTRDPLIDWLPVLRHSDHTGWFKLKLQALHCAWARVAAEVLLRAHEELADAGALEQLPSLQGLMWHTALHDRLGAKAGEVPSLDRALGSFGLSPHPRVLMLVEGKTELIHIPALLAELGLARSDQVRVQKCGSSDINVQLITRYGITPRLGQKIGDVQLLDRIPTALVVVMDPEHQWTTQATRDNVRRILRDAIREEVELQGGEIGDSDLDWLVNIHVWGEDKYELANFTNDELVPKITEIALSRGNPLASTDGWEPELRAKLEAARQNHHDIKVPLGQMRIGDIKTALATALWPVLLAKCELELASGKITTPVLERVLEVRQIVARLSGTGYALQRPPYDETHAGE
ncbi:hypothetical protein KDK95_16620 [Actinospica sp. MGRD01-02]|uniref:Uncharacterized protein n=1 Tax=Actinospica acidithermotolerans TaxID=2828514 RepID=A0A941EB17_9ACTN|nr:hypothetical protein [Actinospica acidithermotolerans]MBR7827942.1 hypothetical protein [Actinospica acidithermotolerans]